VKLLLAGSNNASLPGGVELAQLGAGSQPGMATHTRPLPSNAVPHGSLPGTKKSVTLLRPAARADDSGPTMSVPATRSRATPTAARRVTSQGILIDRRTKRHPLNSGIPEAGVP
jgi:hypothetical protein